MVFENEREGEIKETFSSMPKNERAAQKFSSLLKSRNVIKRKKERDDGRNFRHPTPYQTAISMKIYMHAGWDACRGPFFRMRANLTRKCTIHYQH